MSAPLADEGAQPTQHPARRRVVELVPDAGPAPTQTDRDSYIATVVASAPPLTHEQRDRLRLLLPVKVSSVGTSAQAQQAQGATPHVTSLAEMSPLVVSSSPLSLGSVHGGRRRRPVEGLAGLHLQQCREGGP